MLKSKLSVAPGNENQARAWDGDEGEIWARDSHFFESSLRQHQVKLMEAAAIGAHARVLDVGCGTGDSTRDAARVAKHGSATGIDLSARMLQRAHAIAAAEGIANVSFVQGDAQHFPFQTASFDVVISRTGTMFFADQAAAFANIARAMPSGGRLALESWQGPDHNEWFSSFVDAMTLGRGLALPPPGTPNPFAHANPSDIETILDRAGFCDIHVVPLHLPMYFGATVVEGYTVLTELLRWMSRELKPSGKAEALQRLHDTLESHRTPDGPAFGSAMWLVTARRR